MLSNGAFSGSRLTEVKACIVFVRLVLLKVARFPNLYSDTQLCYQLSLESIMSSVQSV